MIELYKQYPALFVTAILAIVTAVAQYFGLVVDEESATQIIGEVLVLILGGTVIHRRVSPVPDSQVGFKGE